MSDVSWVLLAATLLAGAASPGPSLALVLRGSLFGGQSAGLVIALAHGIGVWLYAMAVVLGVATVLLHIDWIMLMVQVLGAVFLCYLGTMMIRSGVASSTEDEQVSQIDSAALPPMAVRQRRLFDCLSQPQNHDFLLGRVQSIFNAGTAPTDSTDSGGAGGRD